ncbi:MAG: branched-chain amino acid ABC transporter permease [Acholeplasmataceae bacterium]|jgi:branched-chain amino acid transport system permease protein|nr:branched-chain amino acid ABC transporter permease [Acholeplasmataceae bacterium]
MIKILLTELLGYLLFLVFVYIEEPILVVAFIAAMAIAGITLKKRAGLLLQELEKTYVENIGKVGLIAVMIALTIPFAIMGDSYWLQILNFMMLNAMMALGLNFMTGRAGLICLGYAAFMAIGAYTVGILTLKAGISFWIALPFAGVFASLFGVILGLPALRVKGHYLALVTIAFGLIVQELLLNLESVTGGTNGLIDIPSPHFLGIDMGTTVNFGFMSMTYQANFYYLCLALLVLTTVVIYRFSNSLFGLALNAMREDQLAAQCYGLNLTNYKLLAFAIGAFFGGIAGGVYAAMINFIAPENFGYSLSIIVISMIILGGLDSIPGALVGAFFLTVFPEKFRAFEDYRVMFYGIIIVLCLLFMREGLLPFKHRIFKPKTAARGEEN